MQKPYGRRLADDLRRRKIKELLERVIIKASQIPMWAQLDLVDVEHEVYCIDGMICGGSAFNSGQAPSDKVDICSKCDLGKFDEDGGECWHEHAKDRVTGKRLTCRRARGRKRRCSLLEHGVPGCYPKETDA
jgi:hypothetical protein